jgi:hypothetical protein
MKTTLIILLVSIIILISLLLIENSERKNGSTQKNIHSNINTSYNGEILNKKQRGLNLDADSIGLNIIFHKPRLVFRYSDNHCNSCVEQYLRFFYTHKFHDALIGNLVILANYEEFRSFKMINTIYHFNFEAYNFKNSLFPNDDNLDPYLMVVDTNLVITNFFLLNSNTENKIDDYFESIVSSTLLD